MNRHIHVIGIGAGDPDYLTVQAIAALNDTQVFFAMDKGEAKSDLVALRREICARFIREPGYRFVELPDPKRAADGPDTRIWWGAYLGTEDELLVAGTVGEVGTQIVALRAQARTRRGWIMDTYLLRAA